MRANTWVGAMSETNGNGCGSSGVRVAGRLRPMDASLNLPADSFSLVVRREIAWAAANGSFESAVADVGRLTGATVHKGW